MVVAWPDLVPSIVCFGCREDREEGILMLPSTIWWRECGTLVELGVVIAVSKLQRRSSTLPTT